MKQLMPLSPKTAILAFCITITTVLSAMAQQAPGRHPAYLHALSDLRSARWMIQHRPGNWVQTDYEMNAIKEIDGAINEIIQASINDGKDINDHPPMDEIPDHAGRLHQAHEFLNTARQDVDQEEDDPFTRGLKRRSMKHINAAIGFLRAAAHS